MSTRLARFFLPLAVLAGLSTTCRHDEPAAENERVVRERLTALLESDLERGAFVIFEEASSGKFVQFAGSSTEPLILDLPVQTLGEDDLPRATVLFRGYGVSLESWETYDHPGGRVVATQSGFQMPLGRDVEKAVEIAVRVFSDVYRFPDDFDLRVTESL